MVDKAYWSRRSDMMYYSYIDAIVRGVTQNARSLLDVGAANATYLEEFEWIPRRVALDKKTVYSSPNVEGIVVDFFDYRPHEKFDIVMCLQVLEHVPDAAKFAKRLFEIGRNVLISVPYKWRAGDCKWHIHDPVDERKLMDWTGRTPDYSVVVSEVLLTNASRRLIAYYNDAGTAFNLKLSREKMRESYSKSTDARARQVKPGAV